MFIEHGGFDIVADYLLSKMPALPILASQCLLVLIDKGNFYHEFIDRQCAAHVGAFHKIQNL